MSGFFLLAKAWYVTVRFRSFIARLVLGLLRAVRKSLI